MKKRLNILLFILVSTEAQAEYYNRHLALDNKPILTTSSSCINPKTRIYDNDIAPLGGLSVGSESYHSLVDALIRNSKLNGFIANEGNVGATIFDRFFCLKDRI